MTYDQERARQAPSPSPLPGRRDPRRGPAVPHPAPPGEAPEARTEVLVHESLLAQDDRDRLAARLQHALGTFVRSPHEAVEEADVTFAEATTRLTAALVERRHAIGAAHRDFGADTDTEAETEDLRTALRQYRELTLRLLRM